MASSSNKLVDKYQYNQAQVKVEGNVQYITAKHIVLKELFTLKKINIADPQNICKYTSMVNEMNVLKVLNASTQVMKCHKMLKTSNNLYVVFDLMGSNPTLEEHMNCTPNIPQKAKNAILLQFTKLLKQLKDYSISLCQLNPKNIQISKKGDLKIVNLEGAIQLNQKINSLIFQNIEITSYTAPELKTFINEIRGNRQDVDYNLFSEKLSKIDIYSLGKIFEKIYQNENGSVPEFINKMMSTDPNCRPSIKEVEKFLSLTNTQQQKSKIKIFRAAFAITPLKVEKSQISRSTSKIQNSITLTKQLLSPQFQIKRSIKSSGDLDSPMMPKMKGLGVSSYNNAESDASDEEAHKLLVYKVIKRRNLCKMLLEIAKFLFQIPFTNQTLKIMLAFLVIKKSVLLICSLARYLSTGKGETEQFRFKDTTRRQFSKTHDYFKLSVAINKEMDLARNMFRNCITVILTNIPEICEIPEYDFNNQCKSEAINFNLLTAVVKKFVKEVVIKINNLHRVPSKTPSKKTKKQIFSLKDPDYMSGSTRSQRQIDLLQISVRSAKSFRSNLSISSAGDIQVDEYDNSIIQRFLTHQQMRIIYLLSLILDFDSYEKMFEKLIIDQQTDFKNQSFIRKISKMESRQIMAKLQEMCK